MELLNEIGKILSGPETAITANLYYQQFLIDSVIMLLIYIILFLKNKSPLKFINIKHYLIKWTIAMVIAFITLLYTNKFSLHFIPCFVGLASANYIKAFIDTKVFGKPTIEEESVETVKDKENNCSNDDSLMSINEATEKGYYEPNLNDVNVEGVSFNQFNIIMVLKIYGYISPNQMHKMITNNIFMSTEKQVKSLLDMQVLTEKELREANALLNLIKLKQKLVTKEELYAYIAANNLNLDETNESKEEPE